MSDLQTKCDSLKAVNEQLKAKLAELNEFYETLRRKAEGAEQRGADSASRQAHAPDGHI